VLTLFSFFLNLPLRRSWAADRCNDRAAELGVREPVSLAPALLIAAPSIGVKEISEKSLTSLTTTIQLKTA